MAREITGGSGEPTLFEWAGGSAALTRLTRLFYERFVPADPLLGPLFANMASDHPERVAAWLGEVFGGPTLYSERHGGYSRMVSAHLGRALTEQQRARWVELLCRCADECDLPDDPAFRASFVSYLEWGSRIAKANSAPGARPPIHMPVPRWWWVCGTAPDSGKSIPVGPSQAENGVTVPPPGERISYAVHIKPLFREGDRRSMLFAFDLWSYDDVHEHAAAILARLEQGTMPCDGAWPAARVAVFSRWVTEGAPA
jgi:truncated hemoglobin YjbI